MQSRTPRRTCFVPSSYALAQGAYANIRIHRFLRWQGDPSFKIPSNHPGIVVFNNDDELGAQTILIFSRCQSSFSFEIRLWRCPSLGDGTVLGEIRTEIPYADALKLASMTPVTSSRHRSSSQHPRDLNFTDSNITEDGPSTTQPHFAPLASLMLSSRSNDASGVSSDQCEIFLYSS